jgi:Zn-finger nucleic acid-binding protein
VPLGDEPLIRHCPTCKGSWIAEATLHQRADAALGAQRGRRLSWHVEARAALGCAICSRPMETLVVRDAPVDRCPAHGIWFDAGELAHVLAPVALVPAAAAAGSTPDRGDGEVVELVVDTAEVATEVAVDVAETGGGVFEVVVDGVGVVAEAVISAIGALFD